MPHPAKHRPRWRRASRVAAVTATVAAATLGSTAIARGQGSVAADAGLELEWRAPSECPSAEAVRSDVRSLLASGRESPAAPLRVVAILTGDPSTGYVLVVRADGRERRLEGPSCGRLAQAAALLVALLLDPSLGQQSPAEEAEAPPPPTTPPPTAPPPPAPPPTPPTDVPAPPPPLSLALRAGVELDVGTWPRVETSALVGVAAEHRWATLGLTLAAGAPAELPVSGGGALSVVPFGWRLEPGLRFARGRWGFEPTATTELALAAVSARGLDPERRLAPSLGLGADARGTYTAGRHCRLWLALGLLVPVWSPRLLVAESGTEYEPGTALRASVGLGGLR